MSVGKPMNWVDYPDDDSSSCSSDSSIEETNPEIGKLSKIGQTYSYVWLFIDASTADQTTRSLIEEIRFKEQNYATYRNDEKNGYDVKVDKKYAVKLLIQGFHNVKNTRIYVHEKNFTNNKQHQKARGDKRRNEKRKNNFRSQKKDFNNQRSSHKTIKYVNKDTGEAPKNREKQQRRELIEKERKYSRREAEVMGNQLGKFRNTPLEERRKDEKNEQVESQYMIHREHPRKLQRKEQEFKSLKSAPKKIWIEKKQNTKQADSTEQQKNKFNTNKQRNFKEGGYKFLGVKENEKYLNQDSKTRYIEKIRKQSADEEQTHEYYARGQSKRNQNYHSRK